MVRRTKKATSKSSLPGKYLIEEEYYSTRYLPLWTDDNGGIFRSGLVSARAEACCWQVFLGILELSVSLSR